jgi:hypothetical protein
MKGSEVEESPPLIAFFSYDEEKKRRIYVDTSEAANKTENKVEET